MLANLEELKNSVTNLFAKVKFVIEEKLDKDANAVSASKLAQPFNFSLGGYYASGSVSIDGSGDAVLNLDLFDNGIAPGSYGNGASIPRITVNSKGMITSISTVPVPAQPDASTTVKGIVQLSNNTSGTSQVLAATERAVGTAFGVAANAIPKAQQGIANGVATLDATGKIPAAQIPAPAAQPDGTLTTKGLVQLDSGINNVSETVAATPKAVKISYDLALSMIPQTWRGNANGVASLGSDGKVPTAQLPAATAPADGSVTVKGIVQLSSSTSSASEAFAATPLAVKGAYDLAALAIPKSQLAVASGVATLGTDGKLLAAQVPTPAAQPDGTLTVKGLVQLSNTYAGNEQTLAATPYALNALSTALSSTIAGKAALASANNFTALQVGAGWGDVFTYAEILTTAAVTINWQTGGVFSYLLSANATLAIPTFNPQTGTPWNTAGKTGQFSFVVRLKMGTTLRTLTWFPGITWLTSTAAAPAVPAVGKTLELIFSTTDGVNFIGRKGPSDY